MLLTVTRHPMRDTGEACKFCDEPATYRLRLMIGEAVLWSFGCADCATPEKMSAALDALIVGSGAEVVDGDA